MVIQLLTELKELFHLIILPKIILYFSQYSGRTASFINIYSVSRRRKFPIDRYVLIESQRPHADSNRFKSLLVILLLVQFTGAHLSVLI